MHVWILKKGHDTRGPFTSKVKLGIINFNLSSTQLSANFLAGFISKLTLTSLTLLVNQTLGGVSLTATDCPTGRRTILPCYLSIAEWSDARSDSPSLLVKHPPEPVLYKVMPLLKHKLKVSVLSKV